jgi:hypothetical protein
VALRGWPRVVLLLASLLACGPDPEEAGSLATGAQQVTFGSLQSLGSFVLTTTVTREVRGPERDDDRAREVATLAWAGPDDFAWSRDKEGDPVQRLLVRGGKAWTGKVAPDRAVPDAEPHRVAVAQAWDPWAALGLVRGQYALQRDERAEPRSFGGRRAWRHVLVVREAATPDEEGGGKPRRKRPPARAWTITRAEGEAWLDEATAVTLSADVKVAAVAGPFAQGGTPEGAAPATPAATTRTITLSVRVEGIGQTPPLPAAPG